MYNPKEYRFIQKVKTTPNKYRPINNKPKIMGFTNSLILTNLRIFRINILPMVRCLHTLNNNLIMELISSKTSTISNKMGTIEEKNDFFNTLSHINIYLISHSQ